jgi:hypothetical protein
VHVVVVSGDLLRVEAECEAAGLGCGVTAGRQLLRDWSWCAGVWAGGMIRGTQFWVSGCNVPACECWGGSSSFERRGFREMVASLN